VVRLDGPTGPESPPPDWANGELLGAVIRSVAAVVRVPMAHSAALGDRVFGWGRQIDVHPIGQRADDGASAVTDEAVAAYVSKYVAKSVGDAGGLDHRITTVDDIRLAAVSPHLRALMGACWRLGDLPELAHLRLRAWAHTLGYRGHCLTKSRRYSTTYRVLRAARSAYRTGDLPGSSASSVTVSSWRYVGSGHTSGEAAIAVGIAEDLALVREIRRGAATPRGRPDD
jgi:hypothetical protein